MYTPPYQMYTGFHVPANLFSPLYLSFLWKDLEIFLENAKKARRLNNHVFSMLKARSPLEDKMACAIKQSGAPVLRMKYSNTLSAFETLPQKVRFMDPLSKERSKLSTP